MYNDIKKNFYWNRLLLIAILLLTLHCSESPEKKTADIGQEEQKSITPEVKRSGKRIIFFGNSLTAGYGLDEQQAFPALIQERIDSLQLSYVVVNAGLSGETSAGGLSRISWILNQPVDIFILELGANDALRGLDLTATNENLQGIINEVLKKDPLIKIIIAGMKAPPNMGQSYAEEFNQIYVTLSEKNGIPLIPFLLENVAGIPALNLDDGKHPNIDGQKIVAENVWKILQQVIGN